MVLYSLLNRGIWFPYKPFRNKNTTNFCLGLHLHLVCLINNSPQSLYLMSVCFTLINLMKVFAASISISLPYFRAGIFDLTKTNPDIFWFKDHILTVPPPPFSTLVIFVTSSWAFEAVIRHLRYSSQCSFSLWSIVSFSMVSIFSLVKTFKFSLKSVTNFIGIEHQKTKYIWVL